MKTIIYEKRLGRYECVKITDNGGDGFKIIFEEPLNGKLTLGDGIFDVVSGVATGCVSKLCEGEIQPVLYCGSRLVSVEPIILSDGRLLFSHTDDEYVRRLSEHYEILAKRIGAIEDAVSAINEKINQPLKF